MKNNWQTKKLGDLCDVITKGTTPTSVGYKFMPNGINFVKIESISVEGKFKFEKFAYISNKCHEALKRSQLKENDILFSIAGALGRTAVVIKDIIPANTNQALAIVRLKKSNEFYRDFILLALNSGFTLEQIKKAKGGVAQQNLSLSQISSFEIPLPPLPEQHRIVKILDEVFVEMAKTKENAQKNLQNAKELFESYLQSVFANPGKDWEEKTLGDVLQKTETIDPTKNPNEEFVYLDVSSVNKDTKQIENAILLMGKNAPSRARKLVKTNDVIFATVRPTHSRVALITEEYNNQVCSTGYFVLRAKIFLNNNLIYYFLLTHDFNKQMEKMQKGASYPAVNDSEVKNIFISFPKSLSEQKSIVSKLDALSAETKKLETIYQQKLANLEELKKSVLKRAFNGDL